MTLISLLRLNQSQHEAVGCPSEPGESLARKLRPDRLRTPSIAAALSPSDQQSTRLQLRQPALDSLAGSAGRLDDLALRAGRVGAQVKDVGDQIVPEQQEGSSRPRQHVILLDRIYKMSSPTSIPRLRAVPAPQQRVEFTATTPAVSFRCRPSELPTSLVIELVPEARAEAAKQAQRAGLPIGTWLRVALEAVRQLDRVSELFETPRDRVVDVLDRHAAETPEVRLISDSTLEAYARALLHPPARANGDQSADRLLVEIPDEHTCSWRLAAISEQMTLDAWASTAAVRVPANVLAWEAAAARRGAYLGEWMLAVAAAANRESARPHV